MTKTHYKSPDQIIEIVTTTDDSRYPRHKAPMAILKMRPQPHTRCRPQWGGITLMFTFDELRALAEAIMSCDPHFHFTMTKSSQNKPETRRRSWRTFNLNRVAAKRTNASR